MKVTQEELLLQIALWSVDGIGRKTFRKILKLLSAHSISLTEFWSRPARYQTLLKLHANQSEALKVFQDRFTPPAYAEYLAAKNISVVHELDPNFPTNLAILDDRPPLIFVQGNINFPERSIAVVGTRKITSYGRLVTEKLVSELVAYDATIISGFMYGVDAMAHQTAVNKQGSTIAVLGFGFEHMYPTTFGDWKRQLIAAGQTFVTEYAPWVAPNQGTFPARNRLMAGMAQGVLVTEAASKSGSHITAEWAAEYGRSIFAVPGPITNPYTEGTKALINEGALCVQSAREIAEDLGWTAQDLKAATHLHLSPLGQALYLELSRNTHALGSLLTHFKKTTGTILTELSYLELAGLITRDSQGWTARKTP